MYVKCFSCYSMQELESEINEFLYTAENVLDFHLIYADGKFFCMIEVMLMN